MVTLRSCFAVPGGPVMKNSAGRDTGTVLRPAPRTVTSPWVVVTSERGAADCSRRAEEVCIT